MIGLMAVKELNVPTANGDHIPLLVLVMQSKTVHLNGPTSVIVIVMNKLIPLLMLFHLFVLNVLLKLKITHNKK